MINKTTQKYVGTITSFNGQTGLIVYENGNLFFDKCNYKGKDNLCNEDIVAFKIRRKSSIYDEFIGRKSHEKEAYDIDLIQYGTLRGKNNLDLTLGNVDVQIGFIKCIIEKDREIIIINSLDEEYKWKDDLHTMQSLEIGDLLIFKADLKEDRKVKICREPQLLEDWIYINNVFENKGSIYIKTNKLNLFDLESSNNEIIIEDFILKVSSKILRKQNIQYFKDSSILSQLIIYNASHSEYLNFNLEDYKSVFITKEDFLNLCLNLFNIIKNYTDKIGIAQTIDFIYKYRLILYKNLYLEEKIKIIKAYISCVLKSEEDVFSPFTNIYTISIQKYHDVINLINLIKEDREIFDYFISETLPFYDSRSLFLLIFGDKIPIKNKTEILKLLIEKFLNLVCISKISDETDATYGNFYTRYYEIYLYHKIFYKADSLPLKFTRESDSTFTNFDILKLILEYNDSDIDLKFDFIKLIFIKSNYSSQRMILEDKICSKYLFSTMWDNIHILGIIKHLNEQLYWNMFEEKYNTLSNNQKLYLWIEGLNNRYDYMELLQTTHILSKDERKKFNKKIREHAKEERFINFLNQVPVAKIEYQNGDEIVYKCKWRNLYYKNSGIIVFLSKDIALPFFQWSSAREEWNWLTNEYFKRKRINDLRICTNQRKITKIEGLDDIEEHIIIADIQHNGSEVYRTKIDSDQLIRIIHNVAARNKCIDFLSRQPSSYNIVDVQELVSNSLGEIKRDISFIFILPYKEYAYIVWESVEYNKSKATYVFRCDEDSAILEVDRLRNYIENNLYIRSRLFKPTCGDDIRLKLNYFARINHDSTSYNIWENRMREAMPFLK